MNNKQDVHILRELAKQTMEVAAQDVQDERRALWRDFNSLRTHRTPVYVLDPQGMWREVFSESELQCENALFRQYENWMRLQLYHASFGDDFVTEPWITVRPTYTNKTPDWRTWGVPIQMQRIAETLAYHLPEPPVTEPGDIAKLVAPDMSIDRETTEQHFAMIEDAVGDIIAVAPDYFPGGVYNISYTLAYLLGPEQMMYQLHDRPEMVHSLSAMIADAATRIYDDAEKQGLLSSCDQSFLSNPGIQAMPYCHELPGPWPRQAVPMSQHWVYDCSQEFEPIGPDMFEEFVLGYLRPFYEKFGLTAYGCCENLTAKIPHLKKISNLRRVAVTPWADDERCAEQLGADYVVSWRPNPSEMLTNGFDPERITRIIRNAKDIYGRHNCHWEINLKDFITVESDRDRLRKWVETARAALNEN
ncbi:MAG: hypothetical protein FWH01_12695 [Oscillospiraceae bacterium]|nr:hypothetical protein [Oscillospiraceae bacterium]